MAGYVIANVVKQSGVDLVCHRERSVAISRLVCHWSMRLPRRCAPRNDIRAPLMAGYVIANVVKQSGLPLLVLASEAWRS